MSPEAAKEHAFKVFRHMGGWFDDPEAALRYAELKMTDHILPEEVHEDWYCQAVATLTNGVDAN
jgi:hypothetical protein